MPGINKTQGNKQSCRGKKISPSDSSLILFFLMPAPNAFLGGWGDALFCLGRLLGIYYYCYYSFLVGMIRMFDVGKEKES